MDENIPADILQDPLKVNLIFKKLRVRCEDYEQQIYSLKKSEAALKAAQDHLHSELESVSSTYQQTIEDLTKKHEYLKKHEHEKLSNVASDYEFQYNLVVQENKELKEKILAITKKLDNWNSESDNSKIDLELKYQIQIAQIERKYGDKLKDITVLLESTMIENTNLIERSNCFKEEATCAKQNLAYKKEEVEQLKEQVLELQEQLATARLNQNKEEGPKHEEKGNSLFAEVNDRRLKLERIVRQQQASYLEMRKQFARAMQENNAIRSQVRSFQYKLDDLLMTSGLEDERFHKAYDEYCHKTKVRMEDMQSKITLLEKELVKDCNVDIIEILDKTRDELKATQSRIDLLCYDKYRLEEKIQKLSKDLNRSKLEVLKQTAENARLQLQVSDLTMDSGLSPISENDLKVKKSENCLNFASPQNNLENKVGNLANNTESSNVVIHKQIENKESKKLSPKRNISSCEAKEDKMFMKENDIMSESTSTSQELDNPSCSNLSSVNSIVYEDTICVQTEPQNKSNVNSPEHEALKNFQIYEDTICLDSQNTRSTCAVEHKQNSQQFEIYEDTVCLATEDNCPTVTCEEGQSPTSIDNRRLEAKHSLSLFNNDSKPSTSIDFEIHEDTICMMCEQPNDSDCENEVFTINDNNFIDNSKPSNEPKDISVEENNSRFSIPTARKPSILKERFDLLANTSKEKILYKKEVKFSESVKCTESSGKCTKLAKTAPEIENKPVTIFLGDPSKTLAVGRWRPPTSSSQK